MKTLSIIWQRLVTAEGATCDRCGGTQDAILAALPRLKQALAPLGIEPQLETRAISLDAFKAAPAESNRIWIGDKSLEEWLGASSGQSVCCNACEGQECRTVELNGVSYETVPEELIVRAGLLAASELLGAQQASCCSPSNNRCCG